jgi:hypothetical protein
MAFVTAQEIAAHGHIAELLTQRVKHRVSRQWVEWHFSRLAATIAPRCNCGCLLIVTRLPGYVAFNCTLCGHRHTEHT